MYLKQFRQIFTIIVAISLFSVATSAASTNKKQDALGPLPKIFAPLSWNIKIEDLRKLFPNSDIIEDIPTDSSDIKVQMASGIVWRYFRESIVLVARKRNMEIRYIGLSTSESREECDSDVAPKWCRNTHNQELVGIFQNLKRIMSNIYGPPDHELKSHMGTDPKQIKIKWEREGFDLQLAINVTEHGSWSVDLFAIKHENRVVNQVCEPWLYSDGNPLTPAPGGLLV